MTHPYEDRYRRVYNAGARFWATPVPTEELAEFVGDSSTCPGPGVIEFGCGEGRDAVFLAKSGFSVTAIDIAPSAIQRAKEWANEEGVEVDFLVNDATALKGIPDESYDFAVSIGCLQMFPRYEDRRRHFAEACRVLKPQGVFYLCSMAVLTKEEAATEFGSRWKHLEAGKLEPRDIVVNGEKRKIPLPVIAAHRAAGEQTTEEMNEAGFRIVRMERKKTASYGMCWIVIAEKR